MFPPRAVGQIKADAAPVERGSELLEERHSVVRKVFLDDENTFSCRARCSLGSLLGAMR